MSCPNFLTKLFYFLTFFILITSCGPDFEEHKVSLDSYEIEDGFSIEVVASEPLLRAPVAMDFDTKGRIWVVEMTDFMKNLDGTGESDATGSIKILEDLDKDGVADHAKTFLDSLAMPRALALVYGGLLYAEPPNLWFLEVKGDSPGKKTLVDSLFAVSGNPEHQPNGLRMNLDNWIYNAKSNFRYRLKDGEWLKEPTSFRGQWGISHDNFGRLYFNTNSRQLLGDYILPNRLIRNHYYIPKTGINQRLTKDERVYPLQPVPVNRGYEAGILDKDSLQLEVTAACGPLVYRGAAFPAGYKQNVFVCVPEANLIKRNILTFYGDSTSAKQAWEGKEFLASLDEGFRPVSLYNGPDGSLYIVDMHRGVIQHYAFLSPYLKRKSKETHLDTIIDFGRILKVSHRPSKSGGRINIEGLTGRQLVKLLSDSNGWIRDRAQQVIVQNKLTKTIPDLKKLALNPKLDLAQVHALYSLEGLEALTPDLLIEVARNSDADVAAHALVLLENFVSEEYASRVQKLISELKQRNDISLDLYLSSTVGTWAQFSQKLFFPFIIEFYGKYKGRQIFVDAILSGVGGTEEALLRDLKQSSEKDLEGLIAGLNDILKRKSEDRPSNIFVAQTAREDGRTAGAKLFRQICASCHGPSGDGTDGLAPSLVHSRYVSKPMERLGLIILHGLKGPMIVDGKEIGDNWVMPALGNNKSLTNSDIANIMAYVSNAFSVSPQGISPDKIEELRSKTPTRGGEYTRIELDSIYPSIK
ncbi:c-type cytochrome [Flavobacteriaceae bacterium F89]|uniref:C-type cytochrome n=1 Tax=Cerina litoralis TaxID=2874477 RepID=A0AAE3EYD4_9FLAO|nr:c-type cytochrome [Cerina litoralis]MCG2462429.1 c-type cytochrome [Cerina litoralis]